MTRDNLRLVVFTMETESTTYEYGFPIEQVHEITRPGNTVKLPGTPPFVEGITNLRGEVIPIVDFKKRFGLGSTVANDTTRVIVVNMGSKKCGVIVDDVLEIVPVPPESLEEAPAVAGGVGSRFIIGVGKVGERLIIALDVVKVLSEREQDELLALGA